MGDRRRPAPHPPGSVKPAPTPARRGRPSRVEGEESSRRIWMFLTERERTALLRVALENRQTIAQVLRDAVNEFVADYGERRVFSCTGNSGPGGS